MIDSLCVSQVGTAFIDDDLVRNAIACDGFLKEAPRRPEISAPREHEVKGLASTIKCPIEIGPIAFDLDIGSLIDR